MIGIGDYDGKRRNRRQVCTRVDQVMFYGKKYRQDKKTGYYVCTSGVRRSLARGYVGTGMGSKGAPGGALYTIWTGTRLITR